MPLVGYFEVHDSVNDSVDAGRDDGLPRFLVSDNMNLFLSEGEVATPNAGLYLVPHKTSPLFYMNSSVDDAESENLESISLLTSKTLAGTSTEIKEHLRKALNSLTFSLTCDVAKDTELLAYYTWVGK